MAYEIDFIGVSKDKSAKDADAICLRWKEGKSSDGQDLYKVGVVDGGFEAHGDAMVQHMNQYYFDDKNGIKKKKEKTIDFLAVTHPDQDHTSGLIKVLENFTVKKIYMNRPWLYVDELIEKVNDNRITQESLRRKLRKKYMTIAAIEDIADEHNIPVQEAFAGTYIEDKLMILSPSKQFYLDLVVQSTPLKEAMTTEQVSIIEEMVKSAKRYLLNILEDWDIETLRDGEETSAENETSLVMRGIVEGAGFLLTGDAGIQALGQAIDYMDSNGENIVTDISFYQIPHHGSRHNVGPTLLDRMIGKKVKKDCSTKRSAIASVAKGSDHPLKMVTNAYIRRGVIPYKTDGKVLHHKVGNMPDRGWSSAEKIPFYEKVEEWDD